MDEFHVLIISVKETLSHHKPLEYAESDAKILEYLYQKITPLNTNIITLCSQDNEKIPTTNKVLNTVEEINKNVRENDTVIVCVQSHGEKDDKGEFYFILANTKSNTDRKIDFSTALKGNDFLEKLSELKAKNIILFADCCYSGALEFSETIKSKILKEQKYFFIISSSLSNQTSHVYPCINGSLFNYAKRKVFEHLFRNQTTENNEDIFLRSILLKIKEEMNELNEKLKTQYAHNKSLSGDDVKDQIFEVKEANNNQIQDPIIGYLLNTSQSLFSRKSLIISSQDTSNLKQILHTKCGFENNSNNTQGSVEDIINETIKDTQTSLFYFDCIFDEERQNFIIKASKSRLPFENFKNILEQNKENNPVQNFIVFLNIDNENKPELKKIKKKIDSLKSELENKINICIVAYINQDNNKSLKEWILETLNNEKKDNEIKKGLTAAQFIQEVQNKSANRMITLLLGLNDIIEIVLEPEKQEHYGTILNWRKNAKNMLPEVNINIEHKDVKIFDIYVERTLEEKYLTRESEEKEETDSKSKDKSQERKETIKEKILLQEIIRKQKDNTNENQSNKLQIIGDAGSGKSIFLLKLFNYIFNNDSLYIPLYISLSDYSNWAKRQTDPNKSDFYNYILEKVLPNIAEILPRTNDEIIKKNQKLLQDYINKGYVFFFLDGLNEIVDSIVIYNLIKEIKKSNSFFSNAHIIFSSRINMFNDNYKKTREFKSYSLCPFKENEIHFFIHKFFEKDSAKAQGLLTLLNGDNQDIKSLVENPLFLTLVCDLWEQGENKLSSIKNKNQLYQHFINGFFESQPDTFFESQPDTFFESQPDTKNHNLCKDIIHDIKQVLRAIAKLALEDSSQGFTIILSHSNINEKLSKLESISKLKTELGNTDEEGKILWWIVRLEWLIIQDKSQNTFKFNHPSFQEYFAATAIDDGDYFLPSEHKKKPIKHKEYRIFDRTWKEVILFWLGAETKTKAEEEKREKFMQRLVTFQDATGEEQFYKIRAYLLALRGLLEFPNFSDAEEIIKNVFEFNLGLRRNLFESNSLWNYKKITPKFIKREILEVLSEIKPVLTTKSNIIETDIIKNLIDGLNKQDLPPAERTFLPDFIFNKYAIETLGKIQSNITTDLLTRLFKIFSSPINQKKYYLYKQNIVKTLAERFVDVPQEFWIKALNDPDSAIRQFTSLTLKNVNEPSVIDIFIPFLLKKDYAIYGKILDNFFDVLKTETSKDVIEKIVESLIKALLYHPNDDFITWRIAKTLGDQRNLTNSEFIDNILKDEEKKLVIIQALKYAVQNRYYSSQIKEFWQNFHIDLGDEEEQNLYHFTPTELENMRDIQNKYLNSTLQTKDIGFLTQKIIDTNYHEDFRLLILDYLIKNISYPVMLALIEILRNNNNEKISFGFRKIMHIKLAETESDLLIDELVKIIKSHLEFSQNDNFSSLLSFGYIGYDAKKILSLIKSNKVTEKLINLLNLLDHKSLISNTVENWIIEEIENRYLDQKMSDQVLDALIKILIFNNWDDVTSYKETAIIASRYLTKIAKEPTQFKKIVYNYNNKINSRIIWHCATNLSYSDFYEALHNLPN